MNLNWLMNMPWWQWWVLALVMLIVETMVPGAIFMWLGVSAAVVGLLVLVLDIGWQLQWTIFAIGSVLSIVLWRGYQKKHPTVSTHPYLNMRAKRYQGRVLTLDEPIVNGSGRAKVGDTVWIITGPDLPRGSKVKVIGAQGARLVVEAQGN